MVGLLDELGVGIPITGAGFLQARFSLSASALTLALFTLPIAFATLVEPPLLLWASGKPRARGAAISVLAIALGALLAAFVQSYEALVFALMLWYTATGLASGLAQAELMDRAPHERELSLSRWTLASSIGDLIAPSLLSLSVALGLRDRGALLVVALCCVLTACSLWRLPTQAPNPAEEQEEEEPSLGKPPREIVQNRPLLLWLLAASLCDLMDETLAALAALRVHQRFGDDPRALALVLTAFMASSLLGLSALERLLPRIAARRLLALSCVGSALVFLAFVAADSLWTLALTAFLLELFVVAHYPLTQAQAYAAAPSHSAWVATLSSVFSGLTLVYAPLIGWVADRHGLTSALLLLLAQPLGVLLLAALATAAERRR